MKRTLEEIIGAVKANKDKGLSTFMAMTTSLYDAEWDDLLPLIERLQEFYIASSINPSEVAKQHAEEWKRQIINAGADENVAQQAVALAALNGLFDWHQRAVNIRSCKCGLTDEGRCPVCISLPEFGGRNGGSMGRADSVKKD